MAIAGDPKVVNLETVQHLLGWALSVDLEDKSTHALIGDMLTAIGLWDEKERNFEVARRWIAWIEKVSVVFL
jgi:hypothetical protein